MTDEEYRQMRMAESGEDMMTAMGIPMLMYF